MNRIYVLALAGVSAMVFNSAFAGDYDTVQDTWTHERFVHAKVISSQPIYREVRVSTPIKECWQEPVTKVRRVHRQRGDAGATLAGGLIGGIIGHQFGKGRGRKVSTALGTIIGAQIGHDASRGAHVEADSTYTEYAKFCEIDHQVSYQQELEGYRVTYKYKGEKYQARLPYDPGDKIKLRVTVEPAL